MNDSCGNLFCDCTVGGLYACIIHAGDLYIGFH
jgi:hypothetical protein